MFSHQKFTELNDLSCQDIGGKILFATDDWFAGNNFDNWQNGFYPHSSSKLFVFVILLLFLSRRDPFMGRLVDLLILV